MRSQLAHRLPLALTAVVAVACAQEGAPGSADDPTAPSRAEAAGAAAVPAPDLDSLGAANQVFAIDLYRELAKQNAGENLVFSPYSISAALALTYAGARGATAKEFAKTLHFELPKPVLHASFELAAKELASRGRDRAGADGTPFRLNVSNAVWAQQRYPFEPAFLATARKYYGAEPTSLDFENAPEPSRATINAQVAKDTENLIPELLPEGTIDEQTRLVLTNTVYFNASWRVPFDERATRDAPFTRLDGSKVSVRQMTKELYVPYARGAGYQAVALPYASDELSFVAILPDAGKLEQIEAGLSQDWFDDVRASLADTRLEVGLPKLDYRAKASLPETLKALGLRIAFTDASDLTGLSPSSLKISDVVHEAVIKVFEGGTIAAAATGVVAAPTSIREPAPKLTLDRPFLYAIVDAPTSQVLFLGRVTDPTAR